MMDDREIGLIAAFRLHEVAGRLSVLARVARSSELRETLAAVAADLADREQKISALARQLPAERSEAAPASRQHS